MYYLGIDLGGTNIAAGIVDGQGKIIHKDSIPTFKGRPYQEIVKDMADLSTKVIQDAGLDQKDVSSIGIGCPGATDNKQGIIVFSCNLYFRNVPLRTEMQKYIQLPVFIENDANCAALAESVAGAAKGVDHSVTITLGTGIGGGIVINGAVYRGFNNAASEMGHVVIMVDGEQCNCGRKGCWESYASATALIRQTREATLKSPASIINQLVKGDLSKVDAKTAFDAAKQGDETGKQVVRRYIQYVAEGLVNVINTLQPEILVIGGGICKEGDYLLKPLHLLVDERVYTRDVPQTRIIIAQMGNDAGIVGAAMLGK